MNRLHIKDMKILDCTLRDGGYYNSWDFPVDIVKDYLLAMEAAKVDIVELGLRSLKNNGFSGAYAYTTDEWLNQFDIPNSLTVGVMINGSEIVGDVNQTEVLEKLFPVKANDTCVSLVRIACHAYEFKDSLPAVDWLKARGYLVGFNLMQIVDRSEEEILELAKEASKYSSIDALYFADSMGSMVTNDVKKIIKLIRTYWNGELGIHTHDNMGLALQNTITASENGVTWLDSTITGMGRGPGNARTEEIVIMMSELRKQKVNIVPLMTLIRTYFDPMKKECGWGSNPYYFLSGKYGIHPSYIQEMMSDNRYSEEDILAAIEHLRDEGGKKFKLDSLDASRKFYTGEPKGTWNPKKLFNNREVLIMGTGPGAKLHKEAIQAYIRKNKPIVVALNAQTPIDSSLIDVRIACHPVRLLADCEAHVNLPQPLITPVSMLPNDVVESLSNKQMLDYGISVSDTGFIFGEIFCTIPCTMVFAYALATINSGSAKAITMVGFDGYPDGDPRNKESRDILNSYYNSNDHLALESLTPTKYAISRKSIYGLM